MNGIFWILKLYLQTAYTRILLPGGGGVNKPQGFSLQDVLLSLSFSSQGFSFLSGCFVIGLSLDLVPPPHDLEQRDQDFHDPHIQSTETFKS